MPQTAHNDKQHRAILQSIAHRSMLERGLLPDFSAAALAELGRIKSPAMNEGAAVGTKHQIRDLRDLLWASIDNDDSRDFDQLIFCRGYVCRRSKDSGCYLRRGRGY
jgi:exoribonuclease-2